MLLIEKPPPTRILNGRCVLGRCLRGRDWGPVTTLPNPYWGALSAATRPPRPYRNQNWCRVWLTLQFSTQSLPEFQGEHIESYIPLFGYSPSWLEVLGTTQREQTTKGYFRETDGKFSEIIQAHWHVLSQGKFPPTPPCNIFSST